MHYANGCCTATTMTLTSIKPRSPCIGLTEGLLWYSTGHNNLRKFWFPCHVMYDPSIFHDSLSTGHIKIDD